MSAPTFCISPENGIDAQVVEDLLDEAFGIERRVLTSYRLREGVDPIRELSFACWRGDELVGSLRFWPIRIAGTWDALLLGPLAVSPSIRGQGCGVELMKTGLARAAELGHERVILVGDEPYYARVGFARVPDDTLIMPGYVDPDRLLSRELVEGAMEGVRGLIGRAESRAETA